MECRLSEFSEFGETNTCKSPRHELGQFKDHVSRMCLGGASWSLTQETVGSSLFTVMTNISVTEFSEFNETFRENSNLSPRRN